MGRGWGGACAGGELGGGDAGEAEVGAGWAAGHCGVLRGVVGVGVGGSCWRGW